MKDLVKAIKLIVRSARWLRFGEKAILHPERSQSTFNGSGGSGRIASSGYLRPNTSPRSECADSLAFIPGPDSDADKAPKKISRNLASYAIRAWACALGALGTTLPPWDDKHAPPLSPLLKEYCHYRQAHNGVSERTLVRDVETARGFLGELRGRTKAIARASLSDVDAFAVLLESFTLMAIERDPAMR
jgi:hypothetical protein